MWVNSGCGGRFQVTRTPQDSGHGNGSNAGYAIAAVAAIAGLALLANSNRNDGGKLIVWPCSGAANQRWRARGRDIVSDLNGKCMAVWEGRAQQGQRVVTWGCNGSTNQQWWW